MANILKSGKSYVDIYNASHPDAYMVITSSMSSNDPARSPAQRFQFTIAIFHDSASRDAAFPPLFTMSYDMSLANMVTYLASPVAASSTEIPLEFMKKAIYTYLGTELPVTPTINWTDWKSDVPGGVPQTIFHQPA